MRPPAPSAVIKVPISSDDLHRINAELEKHGEFIPPTFDYSPHATVAYVKPEASFKYVGMSLAYGKRFTASAATISKRDGSSLLVKLEGQAVPLSKVTDDFPTAGGYGNLSGQGFQESQSSLGPQGEPLFAAREFDPEQPRDKSGIFSMGTVAKFENKIEGTTAHVTKFEGKFHVNVLKNGQPHLPGTIYSDQQEAVDKAKELIGKRSSPTCYRCADGMRIWF